METTDEPFTREEQALARAVLDRFATEVFRDPVHGARWEESSAGVSTALEVLASAGTDPGVGRAFDACVAAAGNPRSRALDHARLFGATPRGGATPYETEWCGAAGELLQYHQISDIAGFYRAFGLELGMGCDERADHISIELAFLHFLCVKEAYAEERRDPALAETCRNAQRRFLSEHLGRWAPDFCQRLAGFDDGGFYGAAARFLESWIADQSRRLGVDRSSAKAELGESSVTLDDLCVGCRQAVSCMTRTSAPVPHG